MNPGYGIPKKVGWFSAFFLALLIVGHLQTCFGQPTLHTIMANGPVSNRLNIVVLSEGYTSGQLAQFLVDATNAVNNLFGFAPYQEYRGYCNAYAISVPSVQSGSSHTSPSYSGQGLRNTYFNSSFDALFDYVITIPPNTVDANYADGQGKVDSLLQSLMPQCGLPMLLVNEPLYQGGSGGPISIISAYDTSYYPEITVHEYGHTLGKLGDEYSYSYGTEFANFPNAEAPNTTQTTNLQSIKWNAWIPTNTPIPTEEANQQYAGVIGLFQGAQYQSNGWYRPKLHCMMNSLDAPFCEVCAETLVKAIYQKARPVDAFSPGTNSVTINSNQAVVFSISPLQPATHNLSTQWLTNGIAIAGATNVTYMLMPSNFPNGTYTLAARVRDLTPLVRNDPSNLLITNVTWTVNVSLGQLQIDSLNWIPGGQFSFRLAGAAPHGFIIQGSTNLSSWTPLSTNSLTGGQSFYTNNVITNTVRRFYRALLLP